MNKIQRILAAAGIASALVCMSATASMAAPTTSPAASASQTAVAPGYQSQQLGQLTSAYPATGRDVPEQVKAPILADLAPQLSLSYTFNNAATAPTAGLLLGEYPSAISGLPSLFQSPTAMVRTLLPP